MIPFDLTSWFRRRMLPLVALSALILQVSAPTAYYLTKRHELWQQAHAEATRTAMLLHGEIEQRPILWRYNVPKLMERLAAEGMLHGRFLDIRTSSGQVVPIDTAALPRRALWGRAEVLIGGEPAATVWVALDMAPLLHGTLQLAIGFAGLALALAVVLYWVPVHTVAIAQRRIKTLLGELALTIQEEDRRRIARDLHDGAGQALRRGRDRQAPRQRPRRSAPLRLYPVAPRTQRAGPGRRPGTALRDICRRHRPQGDLRVFGATRPAPQS